MCASAVLTSSALARPAFQSAGTLSVDPPNQSVPGDAEFVIRIMQNADVVTTGAQASIGFDPGFLQLVDVQPGAPYAATELIVGGSLDGVIADANATGQLRCVATFFLPGTGSVDPGEQEFLVLTMRSAPGASGVAPIVLLEDGCVTDGGVVAETPVGILLDAQGEGLAVTAQNGQVTLDPAATAPTPGPTTAGGTATANTPGAGSATRTPTSGVLGSSERPSVDTVSMRVDPSKLEVAQGAEFSFEIKQKVGVATTSASVEVSFSKDVVELTAITPGDEWKAATGASESSLTAAVEEANKTGVLKDVGFLLRSGESVAAGETTLATLSLRAKDADGTSPITLTKVALLDAEGNSLEGTSENGEIVVGSGGSSGGGVSMLLIVGIIAAVIAVGASGFYFWRKRTAWA
jgi:hypothetical protein